MRYKILKNEIEDLKKEIRLLKIENKIKGLNTKYNINLEKNNPVFGFDVTYSDKEKWINIFVDSNTNIIDIEQTLKAQLFDIQNKK
jgi:hypothetical protein